MNEQMFIRDAFLLSMERMHNWTFKDSHSMRDREIEEKYSITCSPKSHFVSLFDDERRDSLDTSLSTEQSIFEGWDEMDQERIQLSPKQHLLASKKWASSTAKALSSKKLFNMSNRVMNDISSSSSHRNDSFFEEIMEGALSPRLPSFDAFQSAESNNEMIGLGLEDLHGQTASPLSFDPHRRPRAPFPQDQKSTKSSDVVQTIPKKAAMLLGTYTDQSVSPLSQPIKSPTTRSPCPDRMNRISQLVRPKPDLPLKSPIRPPRRPKRPTESDIFADMVTVPYHQQQKQQLPQRPARRLPKPLPVPTTPLPDVPVSPNEEDVTTPIGWVNDSNKKTSNYSAYNKFEADLVEVEGLFDRETAKVIVEVGGMQFNSTFSTLCLHDTPVRQFGLASWLRKIGTRLEDDSDECRSHSFASSDDGTDLGLSTVENSPSVRTPGLFDHPYNPLDKNISPRNNLSNLPKSVSNESQLSTKRESNAFAYDLDFNAPRNSFGLEFAPRRTSSCSDLQQQHNRQNPSFIDQMPGLVFTPQSNKQKIKSTLKQMSTSSTLQIILPNDRNPLCYPIIFHLLQFGKLPAYFSTKNNKQNQSLLQEVRQECSWLGYLHLSHLCI